MKDWLTSVLARIADGTLLPAAYYSSLDCDAALDAREQNGEFDPAWVRAFDEVDRVWNGTEAEAELRELIEKNRHEGFRAVSQATDEHEIASHVSDDLDLIARGRLLGLQDQFVDGLWSDYERGTLPAPLF